MACKTALQMICTPATPQIPNKIHDAGAEAEATSLYSPGRSEPRTESLTVHASSVFHDEPTLASMTAAVACPCSTENSNVLPAVLPDRGS